MRRVYLGLFAAGLTTISLGVPAQALVWGLDSCGGQVGCPGSDSAPVTLFKFAENGSAFAAVGRVKIGPVEIKVDALAISAPTGLVAFELTAGGSRLVSLDPGTAAATVIGGLLAGRDIRAATFDLAGQLWAGDAAADTLLTIDAGTGAVQTSTALTLGGNPFNLTDVSDIAVDAAGNMVLIEFARGYSVNTATGALTQIFDHSAMVEVPPAFPPVYVGAAYSGHAPPNRLFLFEVNGTDDIDTADGPGFAPSNLYFDVKNQSVGYNSGRGDLAAEPLRGVPEPATLALLTLGLGLLGARRRR